MKVSWVENLHHGGRQSELVFNLFATKIVAQPSLPGSWDMLKALFFKKLSNGC